MPLVAGVDASTTATKVEVRDLDDGRVVGRAAAPHPRTQPPRSEQDPATWWAAFEAAWRELGAPAVAGISVAGQQHGMVALDRDREVIRPAKLWNDTESAADSNWLQVGTGYFDTLRAHRCLDHLVVELESQRAGRLQPRQAVRREPHAPVEPRHPPLGIVEMQ